MALETIYSDELFLMVVTIYALPIGTMTLVTWFRPRSRSHGIGQNVFPVSGQIRHCVCYFCRR